MVVVGVSHKRPSQYIRGVSRIMASHMMMPISPIDGGNIKVIIHKVACHHCEWFSNVGPSNSKLQKVENFVCNTEFGHDRMFYYPV